MQLNNIKQLDDPTKLHASFIICDFDVSHNNGVISKELALEIAPTILNMPLVTKYHKVEEFNTSTDAMGGHEANISTDKYGNEVVDLDTTPIGVFSTEGYIMDYVTPSGETIEVLAADAILWKSRFNDACDLIVEWFENDINVNTSCEILYKNYSFKDGIMYMESPAYLEGHCILNSEIRGDHDIVLPAYDNAKLLSLNQVEQFERLVAQAMVQHNESEEIIPMEDKELKLQFNEISIDDARYKIRDIIKNSIEEKMYVWVREMYSAYAIVSIEDENYSNAEYFKYTYSIAGNEVSVDLESKVQVEEVSEWVSVEKQVEVLTVQINELTAEKELLSTKVSEFETNLNEVKTEKDAIEEKFNSATETIVQLNTVIEELKPIQEQFTQEQFDKALNEKKEIYSAKFEAVGSIEKFESEEVQTLLSSSIVDGDEGKDAIVQLNAILVELVTKDLTIKGNPTIRELSSKRENLLPNDDSFESRYK